MPLLSQCLPPSLFNGGCHISQVQGYVLKVILSPHFAAFILPRNLMRGPTLAPENIPDTNTLPLLNLNDFFAY